MLAASDLALGARLRGVTAALRPGEIAAICGPNGAGKSTLLACLAGLLSADGGNVSLDSAPLGSVKAQRRAQAIGFLPQSPEIAWDVSVATLVSLGRLPWGDCDQAAIDAAMAAMELEDLRDRPVSQLSGGERGRALMARVLAGQPRWLLADEPLANLDLAHQLALLGKLRAEADAGRGVVLVLHDLAQAINHADRVLVLEAGKLVEDGAAETALAAEVIARVWGVNAHWLGAPGSRALAVG
ncbi:MAG: ABC transporter ATP-binding protein [Novosphingobium sp.]